MMIEGENRARGAVLVRTLFMFRTEDDKTWRSKSACRNHDPEYWFSALPTYRLKAISICRTCPVIDQCLSWGKGTKQRFGIWGGVDIEAEIDAAARAKIEERRARFDTVENQPEFKRHYHMRIRRGSCSIADRIKDAEERYSFETEDGVLITPHIDHIARYLGYSNTRSFSRALYRRGEEGQEILARLKAAKGIIPEGESESPPRLGDDIFTQALAQRVTKAEEEYPGCDMESMARVLDYCSAGAFERALYRCGEPGKEILARLKGRRAASSATVIASPMGYKTTKAKTLSIKGEEGRC